MGDGGLKRRRHCKVPRAPGANRRRVSLLGSSVSGGLPLGFVQAGEASCPAFGGHGGRR